MCRHATKIGQTLFISWYALAIITDLEVELTFLFTPHDDDLFCTCINAVFHKLGYCFQGICLTFSDDADCILVIGNAQLSGAHAFFYLFAYGFGHY